MIEYNKGDEVKKIKIREYEFTIKEVDKEEPDFSDENGELRLFGQTIYTKQEIKLYKELSREKKKNTLIHELTHAYLYVYLESIRVRDRFDEEDICCFIGAYGEEIIRVANEYLGDE